MNEINQYDKMRLQHPKKHNIIKRTMIVEKSFHQIQISEKILYRNIKTYKGNRKDTNLLNINFKTIICRILQEMCQTKEATAEQMVSIQRYRESPASFESLIELLYKKEPFSGLNQKQQQNGTYLTTSQRQNLKRRRQVKSKNVLRRLRQLFESSEITTRIFKTEGTVVNKLLMLKYLQAIRYTLIGKGVIVKWKQLKSVTVLKSQA